MSINAENINFKDFENICRTCMLVCNLKFIRDNVIQKVIYKLTNIQFNISDELPPHICLKCFEKINEIHEFEFQCKRALTKCLNYGKIKKVSSNDISNDEINQILNENTTLDKCKINNNQNINYSPDDLKNICRTCMLTCDLKIPQNNVILDVFFKLTNIQFENDNEPQQICSKCFEKIKEIHEFSIQCNRTHSTLMKCLSNFKKLQLNEEENISELVTTGEISSNDTVNNKKLKQNNLNEGNISNTSELNTSAQLASYKCDQCSKSFNRSSALRFHIRMHNGERPLKSQPFVRPDHLKFQIISHTGKRKYKCRECSKSFSLKNNLKRHMRIHSGERPYTCKQCSKSFIRSDYLTYHNINHYRTSHKCSECAKMFRDSKSLERHKRIHSGERPFKCNRCSKTFARTDYLKQHNYSCSKKYVINGQSNQ